MTLSIGRTPGGGWFHLPVAIGTQTSAILGIRGSGKTVTATVVVEELLERRHQVVIIDPTDVWFGLKSSADGSAPGYPVVVFGGPHGDLPLEPGMGGAIADMAVELRVPMILSLRHLRKGQQQAFVTEFAEHLYHRKGEVQNRIPLLVAIDEASAFVPQRVGGSEARMVGAIEDLVRRGRSAGLGVMLIDQRPASVNKDVLTQLELLVAHRITSPQDRKALDEWIRQHDTEGHRDVFLEQLPSLPQGVAWVWSPSLDVFDRVAVRMRKTFDSSRTPKPGEAAAAPAAWADVDLQGIRERLAESIEAAEENDPKALKKRIRELEQQIAIVRGPAAVRLEVLEREHAEISAERDRWKQRAEELEAIVAQIRKAVPFLTGAIERYTKGARETTREPALQAPPAEPTAKAEAPSPCSIPPQMSPRRKPELASIENGASRPVTGSQQKILDALATYATFGQHDVDVTALAMLAGYRPGTGHFNNLRGSLNSAGLIRYPEPGRVALTDAGAQLARAKPVRTLQDLHDAWMEVLNGPQRTVLQFLLDIYPGTIGVDLLAERTGYKPNTGHFNNVRGSLRTLGAIEYPRPGRVAASPLLFPEGLRG